MMELKHLHTGLCSLFYLHSCLGSCFRWQKAKVVLSWTLLRSHLVTGVWIEAAYWSAQKYWGERKYWGEQKVGFIHQPGMLLSWPWAPPRLWALSSLCKVPWGCFSHKLAFPFPLQPQCVVSGPKTCPPSVPPHCPPRPLRNHWQRELAPKAWITVKPWIENTPWNFMAPAKGLPSAFSFFPLFTFFLSCSSSSFFFFFNSHSTGHEAITVCSPASLRSVSISEHNTLDFKAALGSAPAHSCFIGFYWFPFL